MNGTLGRTQRIMKEFSSSLSGDTEDKQETGVLLHAMHDLFKEVENDRSNRTYFLRCAYVEIYNEQVFDLLRPDHSSINDSL